MAPPDRHLLVQPDSLHLVRGPRENRVRPAIDPLFRSAAVAYGARAVGVVLTGLQNDGSAGLLAVKQCGGITVVQDPADAPYPEMPRSALEHVEVDYCLPMATMGTVLYQLTQKLPQGILPIPQDIRREVEMAEHPLDQPLTDEELATIAPLSCPECGGPLWEKAQNKLVRYRCREGHSYTADHLMADQEHVLAEALWTAIRTMEERVHVLRKLAQGRRERGQLKIARSCEAQAAELKAQAQYLRQLLLQRDVSL